MAGNAACPVITVKLEIPVMVIGCRLPCCGTVAGCAVCLGRAVQNVIWLINLVAEYALLAG